MIRGPGPLFVLLLLASCTATPPPAPPPPPPPAPAATPPPAADLAWSDLPLSPGGWHYAADASGSSASFGRRDAAPELIVRCDRATRGVRFVRLVASAGPLTITTSYAGRDWPLTAGEPGSSAVAIPAADPFLDRVAFSRGRVSYALPGAPLLVVPAWAEPARVIEDCRS